MLGNLGVGQPFTRTLNGNKISEAIMNTTKEEVKSLLDKLPDECTLEDVQYHLYVVEKIQRGISRADTEGALSQEEVERKFSKWTTQ